MIDAPDDAGTVPTEGCHYCDPVEALDALVCGYPAVIGNRRCLLVLQGFVDDSLGQDRDIYVLAGFLSTVERWKKFTVEWQEICARDPPAHDFHMAVANRLIEYRWTREQCDERVKALSAVIRRHAMYRLEAVVSSRNYDLIVKGNVLPAIDNPYFLLFYTVLSATAGFLDKACVAGGVDFVFDDQSKVGLDALRWYGWIKENAQANLKARLNSSPIFRHDSDIIPLKAADLFAWHLRRHLEWEQPKGISHNDVLDSMLCMPGARCLIEPDDLQHFADNIGHGFAFRSKANFVVPTSATRDCGG